MGVRKRDYLGEITEHIWVGNTVTVVTKRLNEMNTTVFNLAEYGIRRGGLLEDVIRSTPCPILYSDINIFQRAIRNIAPNKFLQTILSTPTNELTVEDVECVARAIDEIAPILAPSEPYEAFRSVWKIFKRCTTPLKTNVKIAELFYKTQHKENSNTTNITSRFKKLLSDRRDDSFDDPEIAAPISAINYDTPSDQATASLRHLKARLARIEDACVHVLNRHISIRSYLQELKSKGLPECLTAKQRRVLEGKGRLKPKVLRNLSVEARIQVYLHIHERDQYYLKNRINLNIYLDEADLLTPPKTKLTSYQLTNILLSIYFLPSHVLTACFVLIAIATAWNKSTVLALSNDGGIRRKSWGYELTSIKRKTDKLYETNIEDAGRDDDDDVNKAEMDTVRFDLKSPSAIAALELLMDNCRSKERLGYSGKDDLFSSFSRSEPAPYFAPLRVDIAFREFCQHQGIQKFSISEIRDQVAAIDYLKSNQNIYSVQSLLGQSSAEVTTEYLAKTIFHVLHEANINRFTLLLQDDVLFATGRKTGELSKTAMKGKNVRSIIFPISYLEDSTVESTVDRWLSSGGWSRPGVTGPSVLVS